MISEDGLREKSLEVGELIRSSLPKGVCFTLILFTFGDASWINYFSNLQREDMVRAMRDFLFAFETDIPGPRNGAV